MARLTYANASEARVMNVTLHILGEPRASMSVFSAVPNITMYQPATRRSYYRVFHRASTYYRDAYKKTCDTGRKCATDFTVFISQRAHISELRVAVHSQPFYRLRKKPFPIHPNNKRKSDTIYVDG